MSFKKRVPFSSIATAVSFLRVCTKLPSAIDVLFSAATFSVVGWQLMFDLPIGSESYP
jgi:hypothetical protein